MSLNSVVAVSNDRIAVTYYDGIMVLNSQTGEVLCDLAEENLFDHLATVGDIMYVGKSDEEMVLFDTQVSKSPSVFLLDSKRVSRK
jgi:hypothetical protein